MADVKVDGKPDLLVANLCAGYGNCPTGGSVSVLMGNGNGTFQAAVAYASGGVDASSVAVADVNGEVLSAIQTPLQLPQHRHVNSCIRFPSVGT